MMNEMEPGHFTQIKIHDPVLLKGKKQKSEISDTHSINEDWWIFTSFRADFPFLHLKCLGSIREIQTELLLKAVY